jgi:fimbrial isopeptide formation D2 family protein/LPXTG-motif cell wall-anchored protein
MKKILALVLALAMILMVGAAFAGTITITPPNGVAADSTNSYKIYKVFDAVANGSAVSYKVLPGKSGVPAGFTLDDAGNVYLGSVSDTATNAAGEISIKVGGNTKYLVPQTSELTATQISAIKAYIADQSIGSATVSTTGSTPATYDASVGYYFIETTTGTVVTINSAKPDANVEDKNTVPELNKKITGASSVDENGKKALAQLGTTVYYTGDITIGKGAKDYVFHDTMETGLTYNGDAAVTGATAITDYTVGQEGTDTFTVTFKNDYIKTLTVGTVIHVTYSATVNEDAITRDPLNNTAYVSYGDANGNNRTPDSDADVYAAQFSVVKHDGAGQPLAGAGFVIKNEAGKYYHLNTSGSTEVVEWVDDIEDADEHLSDATGAVAPFTGLANGTYTLHEKTVPSGYNGAADSTFTIAEHDYSVGNLEQSSTVVNNSGTELPSTGGIGTTIFYVVGGVMVAGAIIFLLTKRRVGVEE